MPSLLVSARSKSRRKRASVISSRVSLPSPFESKAIMVSLRSASTDKLHWLRAEFAETKFEANRLRLVREFIRHAEAAGDRAEAVRWRTELANFPELAPPPREIK
jgi:hypothetical protein